jgi:hypothetical protein
MAGVVVNSTGERPMPDFMHEDRIVFVKIGRIDDVH